MPVYNAELYLAVAVESILNQSFSDFDFIIIDDGSTDGSLDILQKYAKQDDRIRLVSRENKGIVETLNEGLAMIDTEFVARMDADDIASLDRLEKQVDYLNKNQQCLLLGSRVTIIDSDGDDIREMGSFFSNKEIYEGFLACKGQLIYHPTIVFRNSVIKTIGGYRDKYPYLEDLDLFLRVAEVGEIQNLNAPLLKYREHLTKIGHLHGLQQHENLHKLMAEAMERRGQEYHQDLKVSSLQNMTVTERFSIWGWWALQAGNIKTARKYARKVLLRKPISRNSWNLLLCSIRGY